MEDSRKSVVFKQSSSRTAVEIKKNVMELCMQKKQKRKLNSSPMEIVIFHGKYPSKNGGFPWLFAVYRSVATSKA